MALRRFGLGSEGRPWVIVIPWAAVVLAIVYTTYRLIDPLLPRHFAIAAGIKGSGYDDFAKQFARLLARERVELETCNYSGAVEHFDALRNAASGVQAGITTFGFTGPRDAEILYSLGGVSDSAIFIFWRYWI